MAFELHSDMAFPGFLDGGGTFNSQTADWMFEESRMNDQSDSGSSLPDTNALEEAGAVNKESILEISIEYFLDKALANVSLTGEMLFDQEAINKDVIRKDAINEDTTNREAADEEIGPDDFYHNGRWYRYTTDISLELETLAQDVWAGHVDLTEANQTSDAPPIAAEVEEEDEPHSQAESQPPHIRQDTPIPYWDEEDEDQTPTSRTVTPTTEKGDSEPPSSENMKIQSSEIVQLKENQSVIFVCEIPGCNQGFLDLQYLRKHQQNMHTPMDHRWRVVRLDS